MHAWFLGGWFLLLGALTPPPHDLHLSVTTIQHDSATATLTININVFTDDLEAALAERGTTDLYVGQPNEHPDSNTHIAAYLRDQVQLMVDEQPLTLMDFRKEMTFDAVQCLFTVADIPTAQTFAIHNNIFHELFDDQTNLVRVKANGNRKLISLTKEQLSGTVLL